VEGERNHVVGKLSSDFATRKMWLVFLIALSIRKIRSTPLVFSVAVIEAK